MFVLEQLSGKDFRRVGTAPDWCAEIYPESKFDTAVISPSERFPFLEFFMEEAEIFWEKGEDGVLRSSNWCETGPDGEERYLDAMALNVGPNHLLIINLLGIGTTERQTLLQKGRETQVDLQRELAEGRRREAALKGAGGKEPSVNRLADLRKVISGEIPDADLLAFADALVSRADTVQKGDTSFEEALHASADTHRQLVRQILDDPAKAAALEKLLQ